MERVESLTAHLRGLWSGLEEFCGLLGVDVTDLLALLPEYGVRLAAEYEDLIDEVEADTAVAEACRDSLGELWTSLLH